MKTGLNRLFYFFLLIVLAATGCNQNCESAAQKGNGETNLRTTMHLLTHHIEEVKAKLESGESLSNPLLPATLETYFSGPSDKYKGHEADFQQLASEFQELYHGLNSEFSEKRKEQFNLLVANCIDCHSKFCPGPIRRIKKLRVAE